MVQQNNTLSRRDGAFQESTYLPHFSVTDSQKNEKTATAKDREDA